MAEDTSAIDLFDILPDSTPVVDVFRPPQRTGESAGTYKIYLVGNKVLLFDGKVWATPVPETV